MYLTHSLWFVWFIKFIELVSSKRKSHVKNLATFIFKAFIARNEFLYLRLNNT